MRSAKWCGWTLSLLTFGGLSAARADNITIQTVMVADAGNQADGGAPGHAAGLGAVAYAYRIGKFDITCGQYTAFLNAVAQSDPYGLYNSYMSAYNVSEIRRSGAAGSYSYAVSDACQNRPVVYVSWGDAARFANWLTNGQPQTHVEDATTTEQGSYTILGKTSLTDLMTVTRNANAQVGYSVDSSHPYPLRCGPGLTRLFRVS